MKLLFTDDKIRIMEIAKDIAINSKPSTVTTEDVVKTYKELRDLITESDEDQTT